MTIFSRTVHEDQEKGTQVRVTINEFREVQYLHIRKYFKDFEGEWVPTKDGISMPLGLTNTLALFLALAEIMSDTERELVDESLQNVISYYLETVNQDDPIAI
jgi:hypothetical protein